VIHVLTVHWRSDFWVDAQLARLRRHIREPFRTFAFCDGTRNDHSAKFDWCSPDKGVADHATKLNALADVACRTARDDDVLVFCDSDAFPVRDVGGWLRPGLERFPLLAVQRLENAGDPQPHPCFCATTAGLWRRIGGDWRGGHTWVNAMGLTVTDVGGNLMQRLEQHGVRWHPLRRSNAVNLHPLFFALYGDVVYHHGAGSRPSMGGRAVRLAALSGLDPAAAAVRGRQLQQDVASASRRVLDVVARGDDAELIALLSGPGAEPTGRSGGLEA